MFLFVLYRRIKQNIVRILLTCFAVSVRVAHWTVADVTISWVNLTARAAILTRSVQITRQRWNDTNEDNNYVCLDLVEKLKLYACKVLTRSIFEIPNNEK